MTGTTSIIYGYGFETEYVFQKFSDFLKNHELPPTFLK